MRFLSYTRWFVVALIVATLLTPTAIALLSGAKLVVVDGKSMVPTYQYGDIILIEPATKQDFAPGHVVSVQRADGSIYTHRIKSVHDGTAVLKGDGNKVADPDTVTFNEVIGAVHGHIAQPLATVVAFVQSWPARICLGVTALALIMFPIESLRRERPSRSADTPTFPGRHEAPDDTADDGEALDELTSWVDDPSTLLDQQPSGAHLARHRHEQGRIAQ
ncbi:MULTISPECIES: signal peptidase I [unclassified Curtobacterium]|uniref:signal peptidase I n=1 Tax=unclassified Curtobacterium TaxID=257496 RepID=UPI0003479D1F|nr:MULTISPECIES: signal peptidase I [unclassified Curtobacterium]